MKTRYGKAFAALLMLALAGCGDSPEPDAYPWKRIESPTQNTLMDVASVSPTLAWAVGNAGTILRWDGTAWAEVNSGTNVSLSKVRSASPADGWALGSSGELVQFDGAQWKVVSSGVDVDFNDILALGPTSALAVSDDLEGTSVWQWDGAAWTPKAGGAGLSFGHIWGGGPNDVWVAESTPYGSNADGARVFHYDGSGWVNVTPELSASNHSWKGIVGGGGAVWLLGTTSSTLGGETQTDVVFRRVNGAWERDDSFAGADGDIWLSDNENGFSVGDSGRIERLTAGSWSSSLPVDSNAVRLYGVAGTSPADLWAVGNQGVILKFNPDFVPPES